MHMLGESSGSPAYRVSFVRAHGVREIGHTGDQAYRRSLRDVLALDDLYVRLKRDWGKEFFRKHDQPPGPEDERAFDEKIRSYISLESFFYGTALPDINTYIPVKVFEERDPYNRAGDVTEMIRKVAAGGGSRGLVLLARSGSGKTVASRKAFCDCLLVDAGKEPILAQFAPCWIQIDRELPKNLSGRAVVEYLLLRSAGFDEKQFPVNDTADIPSTPIRHWLNHGPRVLLFFDLNAASAEDRLRVAEGLRQFLGAYEGRGHVCVVKYRSSVPDDAAMNELRGSDAWSFYDMQPLEPDQAVKYLEHIRKLEAQAYGAAGITPPVRDVADECAKLRDLIDRTLRLEDGRTESVVSTPLLMHFASLLESNEFAQVETLSDLFDHVVEKYLAREQEFYAKSLPEYLKSSLGGAGGADLVRLVMTRAALEMLAATGSKDRRLAARGTRLPAADFENLVLRPETWRPGGVGGETWWPDDTFWHKSAYYRNSAVPQSDVPQHQESAAAAKLVTALRERSLLRQEGESLRFVHDSFIYYFAGALALRQFEGPASPPSSAGLPPAWFAKCAERIGRQPETWELPAEFLGGTLTPEQLRGLALGYLTVEPKPNNAALLQRLLHGRRPSNDPVLGNLEWALRWHGPFVHNHPESLAQDAYQWLARRNDDSGECTSFAGRLLGALRKANRRFLRQVYGPRPSLVQTMAEHTEGVTALAVDEAGWVISGSRDRTVKRWNPATGQVQTMAEHNGRVEALAVDEAGWVISGSGDGTVKRWNPATGQVQTMAEHNGIVLALAVDGAGWVISGSENRTVKRWNPATGEVQTYLAYGEIVSLLLHPKSPLVVCGLANDCLEVLAIEPDVADHSLPAFQRGREKPAVITSRWTVHPNPSWLRKAAHRLISWITLPTKTSAQDQ